MIAPPSVNGNGKKYEWQVKVTDTEIQNVPDGYLSFISNKAFNIYRGVTNELLQGVTPVTSCDFMFNKGTRDQDLFHAAN